MTLYVVGSCAPLFRDFIAGKRKHEIRRIDDRHYKIGDFLHLKEYDLDTGDDGEAVAVLRHTRREAVARVTYVSFSTDHTESSRHALHPDYCVLSIDFVGMTGAGH